MLPSPQPSIAETVEAPENPLCSEKLADANPAQSDHLLMERICLGEETALDQLLVRHWSSLVRYAAGFVQGVDAAEDIVQEAFIRLWEIREKWMPGGSPRRFLYTVVRNLCLNERERRSVRIGWSSRSQQQGRVNPTPMEMLQHDEVLRALKAAIDRLPSRRREVFELVYLHGLPYSEVAGIMGIATPTVANQVSAALDTIRRDLSAVTDARF